MTTKEIKQFSAEVDSLIDARRLGDVYATLRNSARAISAWEIFDRIDRAEQGYSYMLKYLVEGSDDPSRADLYDALLLEAGIIRDMLVREMSLPETPTLYFNTLRSVNSHRGESLQSLFDEYRDINDRTSAFDSLLNGGEPSAADRVRAESLERDIFNRLWVTFPLNRDQAAAVDAFIADDSLPVAVRSLVVSALSLGLLEYFDERRLQSLMRAYIINVPQIALRALVGLVMAFDRYRSVSFSRDTLDMLESLRETTNWQADLRQVFVEMIRTNDTKRITEKFNAEILPNIQKLSRDLARNMSKISEADVVNPEGNPEWESLLSNEKVRNDLKELGELQQEGADVFMATFARLKQFPFFNDVANWFMPFRTDISVVADADIDGRATVLKIVESSPYVCDSDKYSMLLSLSLMPAAQRDMIRSQLDAQRADLDEMMSAADRSLHPVERKAEINNYILSTYRFYKLFRRKGEFHDPFLQVVNPVDIPALNADFASEESLVSLGEFYFKIGLYDYALRIFQRLDDICMPDASRCQKLGYCCERLGDYENASSYYEQADLLKGDNIWTLRRLAAVYRLMGNYSEAVSVTCRLEKLLPDDLDVAMNLANLYILQGLYDKAIDRLRKVEFLDEASTRPVRPLAWALMLSRRFDESRTYYDRVLDLNPNATDFLNMGHLAWASGNLSQAVDMYRRSARESSTEILLSSIRADSDYLAKAGVDVSLMPLMLDAVTYAIKQ